MPYHAPLNDYQFLMEHVVGMDRVAATEQFAEATPETVSAILVEAGKLCQEVLAPLNRIADLQPAQLENGVVRCAPGFAEAYRAISDGGYMAMSADPEYGGLGLPMVVTNTVNEMLASACLSLQLNPLMTQGQIEALEHHGSADLKALYLPKLISGVWSGTMNLTEPQAGSDVGALTSKAEPNGDGTYAISGQKIYISWGDNDFTENIVHLVLARLPDAGAGTKGISLFLVPKRIPDENGNAGIANSLRVVSLEHKLGLHGSPTAVMEYDRATGWLVGEEHGGMAAMFTMMNNARLGVGMQGIGVAEAAYQHALAYAQDRKQGRSPTGTISGHADVRRMLAEMKAEIFAARAMAFDLAVALDMARATGAADWSARAALLTPLVKAYGSETGIAVSQAGIQVHGGMGFVEETGAAQFLRDVRVTSIYEGTNGIQAMDLVGRKMMDNGAAIFALLKEIESDSGPVLNQALANLRHATEQMLLLDIAERGAGALPYLMGFARVLGASYHARAAKADPARATLSQIYEARILPKAAADFAASALGSRDLFALSDDDLAA
ncbi:MAG: acyl-CoA dehydrogenase family protein [Pseudomonadota bacterium]